MLVVRNCIRPRRATHPAAQVSPARALRGGPPAPLSHQELEERVLFLEELMKKYGKEPTQDVPLVMPTPLVDVDEAVRLIQANERGRQGRQRSAAMRDMRKEQAYEARMVEKGVTSEARPRGSNPSETHTLEWGGMPRCSVLTCQLGAPDSALIRPLSASLSLCAVFRSADAA